jgi:hypothetical protein
MKDYEYDVWLDKIDLLRERTGLSYNEADSLLNECNGDLIKALILYEQDQSSDGKGSSVWQSIRTLIHQGNTTNIRIARQDKVFLEVPLTAGILGAALSPKLAFIAGAACLLSHCRLELKTDEERLTQSKGFFSEDQA